MSRTSLGLIRTVKRSLQRDGLIATMRKALLRLFGARTIRSGPPTMRFASRMNLDDRWAYVSKALPAKPAWILDVGTNDCDTLFRLGRSGYCALGLEAFPLEMDRPLSKGLAIMHLEVNPTVIESMPSFDAILLLSVFHRIYALQGPETAMNVLSSFSKKTRRLILEGASSHARYTDKGEAAPPFKDMDEISCIGWHMEIFQQATGNQFAVQHIGTNYSLRTGEPRPSFLLISGE